MMAQHVGRSRLVPATILILLVPACVVQLADVDARTTTTTTVTATATKDLEVVRHAAATAADGSSSRVQFTVKSARVTTAAAAAAAAAVVASSALPLGAKPDKRHLHVELLGTGLDRDLALRWSPSSHECPDNPDANLDAVWTSPSGDRAIYEFRTEFPDDAGITTVYFCRRSYTDADTPGWSGLGDHVSIKFPVRLK